MADRVTELEAALGGLLATFKSHIDGRDLLDELHPRSEIDIKVRNDGVERWHEGDWLSNVRRAAHNARLVLGETSTPPLPAWPPLDYVPSPDADTGAAFQGPESCGSAAA